MSVAVLALLTSVALGGKHGGLGPPGHGPKFTLAKGAAPSGGRYRLWVRRFRRSDVCVGIGHRDARGRLSSGGSCGSGVPRRAVFAPTLAEGGPCALYVGGVAASKVKKVLLRLGDGSILEARIIPAPQRLRRRGRRFFLQVIEGAGELVLLRVRALDREGRTLAVHNHPFTASC